MRLPVLLINLDRAVDRCNFMKTQLAAAGLHNVTRISAVDGRTVGRVPEYRPHEWRSRWELTPGELGCFLSHRTAWKQVVASQEVTVILEDDILLCSQFGETIDAVAGRLGGKDLVKLDWLDMPIRRGALPANDSGVELSSLLQPVPSSAAYVLTPEAAEVLLHRSQAFCDTVDDFIFSQQKHLSLFQLERPVCMQAQNSGCASPRASVPAQLSVSQISGETRDKGPVLYRLKKEICRAASRCRERLVTDPVLRLTGGRLDPIEGPSNLPLVLDAT